MFTLARSTARSVLGLNKARAAFAAASAHAHAPLPLPALAFVPATQPFVIRSFSVSIIAAAKEAAAKKTVTKKNSSTKKKPAAKKAAAAKKTKPKAKKTPAKPKKTEAQLRAIEKKKSKPVRPANGYAAYVKEKFATEYKESKSFVEASRAISAAWKNEPQSVKEKYSTQDEQTLAKYKAEKDAWKAKYSRPLSGYTKYIKEKFAAVPVSSVEEGSARFKILAAEWKALSDAEKQSWKNK